MDKKQLENDQKKKFLINKGNELFGINAETSLQSVNFAPTESSYLNEHSQEESEESDD